MSLIYTYYPKSVHWVPSWLPYFTSVKPTCWNDKYTIAWSKIFCALSASIVSWDCFVANLTTGSVKQSGGREAEVYVDLHVPTLRREFRRDSGWVQILSSGLDSPFIGDLKTTKRGHIGKHHDWMTLLPVCPRHQWWSDQWVFVLHLLMYGDSAHIYTLGYTWGEKKH